MRLGPCALREGATWLTFALAALACGDPEQPVRWSASVTAENGIHVGAIVPVRVEARAARGWYFYSITQGEGGPIPARIWLPDSAMFTLAGTVRGPAPTGGFDSVFGMTVEKHSGTSVFSVPVRVEEGAGAGARDLRVNARYQACNDRICHSPRTVTLSVPLTIGAR